MPIPPAVDVQRQVFLLQGIIQLLTGRLGGGQRAFAHLYAMRMVNTLTGEIRCLHQDTTMYQVPMIPMHGDVVNDGCPQVHEQFAGQEDEWRHELRVRILKKFATKQSDSFFAGPSQLWSRRPLHKRNKSLCLKIHINTFSFMLLFSNVPS